MSALWHILAAWGAVNVALPVLGWLRSMTQRAPAAVQRQRWDA